MLEMVRIVTDYFGVDQAQAAETLVAIACIGGTALLCRWIGLGAVATSRVVGKVGSTVMRQCARKEDDPLCAEILRQLDDEVAMLDESSPCTKLEAGGLQVNYAELERPEIIVQNRNVFSDLSYQEQNKVKAKLKATVLRIRERDRLMRRAESLAKLTHVNSNYQPTITQNSPLRKS